MGATTRNIPDELIKSQPEKYKKKQDQQNQTEKAAQEQKQTWHWEESVKQRKTIYNIDTVFPHAKILQRRIL